MYYVRVVVTSETVRAKPSDIMAPCSAEDLGIKDKVIRRGIARGFGTLNNTPQPSIDQSEQVRLTISNRETTESIEETGQSVHEQNAQSENKQTNKQSNKQTIKQTNKKAASNAVKQKKKVVQAKKERRNDRNRHECSIFSMPQLIQGSANHHRSNNKMQRLSTTFQLCSLFSLYS